MASDPTLQTPAPRGASPRVWLARLGPYLDMLVVVLAVCSTATWGWYLWIDLRFAGPLVGTALPVLWTLSVLALPPLLRRAPQSAGVVNALLLPTYLLVACAVANAFYFYPRWVQNLIDASFLFIEGIPPVPMCLWVAALLLLWAWTLRHRARAAAPRPGTFGRRVLRGAWAVFCSSAVVGYCLLYMNENPPPGPVDVAVVLGNRVLEDGRASTTLTDRTLPAVALYHRGWVRKIIVSGMIDEMKDKHTESEALAMRQVCLDQGVPERDIIVDPVGVNTKATAYNTRALLRRHGWQSLVACSHAYHLPRIRMTFRQAGLEAYTLAARPTIWQQGDIREALREGAGLLVYALRPGYRPAKIEELAVQRPRLVIRKAAGTLELYDGPRRVKTYPCLTGRAAGDKQHAGDRKTPEGQFRIICKNPASKFHLSLGLDYPRRSDADRGLAAGLIAPAEHAAILRALAGDLSNEALQKAYWSTRLGGEIFIHGQANRPDTAAARRGSAGCVVVSNDAIEELYVVCELGTPVEILP